MALLGKSHLLPTMSYSSSLPIPNFEIHSNFQNIIQNHVYHEYMDIVSVNLKTTANQGQMILDPSNTSGI